MHSRANSTAFDALVVGAGFAGSVCARRMAEDFGLRVLAGRKIIDVPPIEVISHANLQLR